MAGDQSRAHLVENNQWDRGGSGILAPAKGVDGLSRPWGLSALRFPIPGLPGFARHRSGRRCFTMNDPRQLYKLLLGGSQP
jgi:hypothetical protein